MMEITKTYKIEGMTCDSCEKIITRTLEKQEAITKANASYQQETVTVTFNKEQITEQQIKSLLEEKNYHLNIPEQTINNSQNNKEATNNQETSSTQKNTRKFAFTWVAAILGLLVTGFALFQFSNSFNLPTLTQNMSYPLLFLVGVLTGFHCVGMCGGFMVSYVTKGIKEGHAPLKLHASYGVAKTLSYTLIGALFGLLGSIVAFTPVMKGVAAVLAGLFLIFFGVKMLNVLPKLRSFKITFPKAIEQFRQKWSKKYSGSPVVIGLLNGLMIACGPLQAVYIMAAGTGSPIEGAKLLFVFGLGTLPVMLGFGYVTSIVGKKFAAKVVKYSGVIVIILGIIMLNRGLALAGTGLDMNSLTNSIGNNNQNQVEGFTIKDGYQIIEMDVTRYGWEPNQFTLIKDMPVKWQINGKEINGCNRAIQVPSYNLEFDINPGKQTIEFTPTQTGTVSWSCWMGMIPGSFTVVENPNEAQDLEVEEIPQGPPCTSATCQEDTNSELTDEVILRVNILYEHTIIMQQLSNQAQLDNVLINYNNINSENQNTLSTEMKLEKLAKSMNVDLGQKSAKEQILLLENKMNELMNIWTRYEE